MNLETASTPWAHDELQLIGAELGDTVCFFDEENNSGIGVIVMLTKMTIFILTEQEEILKFGRVTLMSVDNKWDLFGLSEKQIRISSEKWKETKEKINKSLNLGGRKKKNENLL